MEHLAASPGLQLRVSAYAFKGEPSADAMEKRVMAVPGVSYVRRDHDGWSPAVESELAAELAGTDFLLLPYRDASCSIDVPLLLLEGMASGCCILSRPVGEVPAIYGASPFVVADPDFPAAASALIGKCSAADLSSERDRVARRCRELAFDTPSVTDELLRIITENRRGQ